MLKSPDRTNAEGHGLEDAVIAGIDEELAPREELMVLRRGVVPDISEPKWSDFKRAILGIRTVTGRWGGRIAGIVTHRVQFIL